MKTTTHQFRLFAAGDPYDLSYGAWSRVIEYPAVLAELDAIGPGPLRVHNTAAGGFLMCHRRFMGELDRRHRAIHTDLVPSEGISRHDIRQPAPQWEGTFDAVLCVSTLEHLAPDEQQEAVESLLGQLRPGGRLVVTFDLPGADLAFFESVAGWPIDRPAVPLTGEISPLPDPGCASLSVGILSLSREASS